MRCRREYAILNLMLLIHEDKRKRTIKNQEEIKFSSSSSYHLIILTVRAKAEKQISDLSTDDEDLIVRIDDKTFPQLGSNRLLNSPAAFSGGALHNLAKTAYYLMHLQGKDHKIILKTDNPSGTATFEDLKIYTLDSIENITLEPKIQAEDGDRREWITFVLVELGLNVFTVELDLKRRFVDSDDVKVIVDGIIQRNFQSKLRKLWYFIASLFTNETQSATFAPRLNPGLHYIEFWADRMPTFNSIKIEFGEINVNELKIYKDDKFGSDYNQMDNFIIKSTNFWNNFFLNQEYSPPEPLDPNLVKSIVYRESKLGYYPDKDIIDVMQVWDPANPARDAILGKTPANEFINQNRIGHISYSYPADKIPPEVRNREESIFWGVRWLYHKSQYLLENDNGTLTIPYVRKWRTWKQAVRSYNANSDLVEDYVKEVFLVYEKGVDLEGNTLW